MTTRWAPAKKDTLRELAAEIVHNYGRGRVIVAVDGDAAGAPGVGPFADDLADAIRESGRTAFRASLRAFSRRPASAPRDAEPELDESVLRRVLVEPFLLGGSTGWVEAAFDPEADRALEPTWVTGPADAVLVVDGTDLSRPGLSGIWHYRVWVSVGDARAAGRATASAVVGNDDPEHPRRRFDDAC